MNEVVFDIDRLREVALDQYGFVTTAQAEEAGVSAPSLAMLVKRGRLERVVRSVYRVPQVPPSSFDRFMLALLWTGCDEAALSHETALDAYDVCDVNPTSIHVVVDGRAPEFVGRAARVMRSIMKRWTRNKLVGGKGCAA